MEPFLIEDEALAYEPDAVKKHLKGEDIDARLRDLLTALESTEPFDVATSEQALRELADAKGLGAGKYIHPLRLALTGRGTSPPIFDVAVVLGKERSLRRLARMIDQLPSLVS
jgi:glutamyl/glutaminyl-tRNA synthetase